MRLALPQTVLLDLTDSWVTIIGQKHRNLIGKLVLVPLSALVSITMIWYFAPPAEAIAGLFSSPLIARFFIVLWALVWLELALLGRGFCTSIYPYAMMQNTLFDKDTLVIEYDKSRDLTCMKCDDCVRACPVSIDIKEGLSNRCIACTKSIDACLKKSSQRDLPLFPNYTGNIMRPKAHLLWGVTAASALVVVLLFAMRPPVEFTLSRLQEPLPAGLNRYVYTICNNSSKPLELELDAPEGITLIGERTISIAPFSVIQNKVLLRASGTPDAVSLTLHGDGISITKEAGFL